MRSLGHRLLILALAESILLLAVHAIGPLLVVGSERYLLVGTAVGLALSGLWIWSDWLLLVATEIAAIVVGVGLQVLPHSDAHVSATTHRIVALAPAGAVALTVATVCLASLCGWLLAARRTPWPVVALAGSMMLVRADVSRVYEDRFPLFLLAAVALVACTLAPALRRVWWAVPGALIALLLAAAAWQLPTARRPAAISWVGPLAGSAASGDLTAVQDQLPLQGAFHPTDDPVMAVSDSRPELRLYWRMTVFDTYTGQGWTASVPSARFVPAQSMLTSGGGIDNGVIYTQVRLLQPAQALVSAGQPVAASLPAVALYPPGAAAPSAVQSPNVLPAGTQYEVAGSLGALPIESTRERVADLQRPAEPGRVADLAWRLVRGYRGALPRALAIESYLRSRGGFQYDVNAGSPAGGDAVDNFLFESHRGYCTQFASAMVVLARSVGIPARLVTGYATGIPEAGSFLVRARDAHSWAEVYTPSGWVDLDPTPGFNPAPAVPPGLILRFPTATGKVPGGSQPAHALPPGRVRTRPGHAPSSTRRTAPAPFAPLIGGLAAGAILLLAGMAYAARPRSLEGLYRGLVAAAPRRYGGLDPGETPLEFAERFRPVPAEYDDIHLLAGLYARRRYAGWQPTEDELRRARHAWRRLRRRWLLDRLHPWRREVRP